ncbi:hypothetical protein GYMLUDRAFT_48537, partial [Collybiopsis luxurians FD-317 M1]
MVYTNKCSTSWFRTINNRLCISPLLPMHNSDPLSRSLHLHTRFNVRHFSDTATSLSELKELQSLKMATFDGRLSRHPIMIPFPFPVVLIQYMTKQKP